MSSTHAFKMRFNGQRISLKEADDKISFAFKIFPAFKSRSYLVVIIQTGKPFEIVSGDLDVPSIATAKKSTKRQKTLRNSPYFHQTTS